MGNVEPGAGANHEHNNSCLISVVRPDMFMHEKCDPSEHVTPVNQEGDDEFFLRTIVHIRLH